MSSCRRQRFNCHKGAGRKSPLMAQVASLIYKLLDMLGATSAEAVATAASLLKSEQFVVQYLRLSNPGISLAFVFEKIESHVVNPQVMWG
jgi:hypothetical protein